MWTWATSALPYLLSHHIPSFPAKQSFTYHFHSMLWENTHLLYPIAYQCEYSIRHKWCCLVIAFGCFHGIHNFITFCYCFYTWDVLEEVGIKGWWCNGLVLLDGFCQEANKQMCKYQQDNCFLLASRWAAWWSL